MFDKQTVVDRIEALADHTVAVRYVVTVTEDGKPFAEQIKGNYIHPGDDYSPTHSVFHCCWNNGFRRLRFFDVWNSRN